ncbi:hypothetical protein FRX31_004618 [Thalictrum thalictroides]|uniref:F-box domain-containing protein n=1 Tax=Thalictrum thalictroides TaxID=46969 RepID=A0A7J6XBH6_THATH|nr:hypothetical protein FRX31_004618 [Thalictrum thalictroides]
MSSNLLSNAPGKEDILLRIFSLLPIKSILRFKCVSKEFLSLTTNPLFISLHSAALRSITPFTGFFCVRPWSEEESWRSPPSYKDNGIFEYVPIDISSGELFDPAFRFSKHSNSELPDPSLRFLKHEKTDQLYVRDSCNGLLLCSRDDQFDSRTECFVCNPLTKQKVVVPFAGIRFSSSGYYKLIAELTPMGDFTFNVICVYISEKTTCSKLSIFSSEKGSWEKINDKLPPFSQEDMYIPRVYCNGILYWNCFEDYILVYYFDKAKRNQKNGRLYELIKTPRAPLGRSLWDHNGKILCYFHGCHEYDFHVRQLCFNEANNLEWKVEDSEDFKSLEEDISMGYWEHIGKQRSLCPLPKLVCFKVICYDPISKTLFLCIPNAIFLFDIRQRKLEYFWGALTFKFVLVNYVRTYVHSFAPIQVCPLPKPDDSVVYMLKEDTDIKHGGKKASARRKIRSHNKGNVIEKFHQEPEATISDKPIFALNNQGYMEVVDSTPSNNLLLKELRETSNRFAALFSEGESEADDSPTVECLSETYLSSEQPAATEEEESIAEKYNNNLTVSTVISSHSMQKGEGNTVNVSTDLLDHICSDLQTMSKHTNSVADAKTTPTSTIPKSKGKGGKNRRRRNKEMDDKEYELIIKGDPQEFLQTWLPK